MSSKLSGDGSNFMGLYLEAESHSQGSNVAADNVPVAMLDVILLKELFEIGLPQGSQMSSNKDVVSFEFLS